MNTIPAAQPLAGPPAVFGPAVSIAGGPYNGLKGNVTKTCEAWCAVAVDFENSWYELVTETRWLRRLDPPAR